MMWQPQTIAEHILACVGCDLHNFDVDSEVDYVAMVYERVRVNDTMPESHAWTQLGHTWVPSTSDRDDDGYIALWSKGWHCGKTILKCLTLDLILATVNLRSWSNAGPYQAWEVHVNGNVMGCIYKNAATRCRCVWPQGSRARVYCQYLI